MQQTADVRRATPSPLRADPRPGQTAFDAVPEPQAPASQLRVRAVPASSGGLLRATLGSAAAAGAILALFWLPAEYGIDATGLGRVMGLTQMGEIKQQLYAEAAVEDAALAVQAAPAIAAAPEVLERLGAIEAQVAAIAAAVGAATAPQTAPAAAAEPPTPAPNTAPAVPATDAAPPAQTVAPEAPAATAWRDEVAYTLAPGEGIEVKLVMEEGATAAFEWDAGGAVLNYDTHADGSGQKISYEQGRAVPGQAGELVAAFTGNHGWFWRNRTEEPVTLTLRTRGQYAEMRGP